MRRNDDGNGHRRVRFVLPLVVLTMGTLLAGRTAGAQTETTQSSAKAPQETYETLYIRHATDQEQAREIVTVFRNMLQRARIDLVASEDAIAIRGTAEDLATAHKILAELDRPSPTYRLTYIFAGTDGGPGQRYTLTVASGGKAALKQGDKMPIVTGGPAGGTSEANSQVRYVDLGLNVDASVDGGEGGLHLRTRVEQSAIAGEKSGLGGQDPVIRQTLMESVVNLVPGKSVVLGSVEMPGTGKQQEVSAVAEANP